MADHDAFAGTTRSTMLADDASTALEHRLSSAHRRACAGSPLNLHRIDDSDAPARRKRTVSSLICFSTENDPVRALRRMNEVGLLGALIPEFGRIVAMMQFNMYHHYTVDEHTIQCIANLFAIEQGDLVEELPVASVHSRTGGVNRRDPLYRDASARYRQGSCRKRPFRSRRRDRRRPCARVWACPRTRPRPSSGWCENHLLMSDVAQKRDLADPNARCAISPARSKARPA